MSGLNVDIQARTQSAEAALRRLTDAFNRLGQNAAQVSNRTFKLFDDAELGNIDHVRSTLEQIMRMHPSIRTAVRASGQNTASPTSINWGNVPLTPSQVRTLVGHLSGGANRFGRADDVDASRIGENIARGMSRFFGGVGGGAGQVAGGAINGGMGGGGGFSLGGMFRGGLLGLGMFGAFKAGQSVMEGYENAKSLAFEMDKLKRQMGDIGVDFGVLQKAALDASRGLEINGVEAGKLMTQFNHLSGGVKESADLMQGTRVGIGLSKALGLDPGAGVGFLANIRNITRGGSADGDRRLAMMIGDVVTRTGMHGRSGDILQAIQQFATATARISLSSPGLSAFGGAYAGLMGMNIPGLTAENSAAILGRANSAMQSMGAYGDAGKVFMYSSLLRGGDMNPIQAQILAEGGVFGTRAGAFGKDSVYRKFRLSQAKNAQDRAKIEAELDALVGKDGDRTSMSLVKEQFEAMGLTPDLYAETFGNLFGLGKNQAMALAMMNPADVGKTQSLLARKGIDIGSVNESGIMTLSRIAGASGIDDLRAVATDMLGRTGKGSLDQKEAAALNRLLTNANQPGGFEKLQDALTQIAADKGKQETTASKMLDQQARIENAMIGVGQALLPPLVAIKELLVAGFGNSETKAREMAKDIRRREVESDFAARRKAIDAEFQEGVSRLKKPGLFDSADQYVKANKRLQAVRDEKMRALAEDRQKSMADLQDEFDREDKERIEAQKAAQQARDAWKQVDSQSSDVLRSQHQSIINGPTQTGTVVSPGGPMRRNKADFIAAHRAGAEAAARELGVDPKLLLAQAGLETGWGRSVIPGTNNLGNIKAGRSWSGPTKTAFDKAEGSNDAYRVYGSYDEYWQDYVNLIRRRYPGVVGVGSDAAAFASALKDGGYATDPDYEGKLIRTAGGVNLGSTPIPGRDIADDAPQSWRHRQMQSMAPWAPAPWDLTFRLFGEDGRERASPINISVPFPAASGAR